LEQSITRLCSALDVAVQEQYAIAGTGKSRLGHPGTVRALGLLEYAIKNALDEA
jgi:hypothetical protein